MGDKGYTLRAGAKGEVGVSKQREELCLVQQMRCGVIEECAGEL